MKMDKRYRELRTEIDEMFKPSNRVSGDCEELVSPSGDYRLTIDKYSKGPGTWEYSRGRVRSTKDGGILLADVKRNIGHFRHYWIQHAKGNEYLICGEDYQGQTIINLTTGERNDFFPETGYAGGGFCWADAWQSPDSSFLAVEGCVWGGPYELVFYDFSEPDLLPYKELFRVNDIDKCNSWLNENTFHLSQEIHVRSADGCPYRELTEKEQEEIDDDEEELSTYIFRKVLVTREQILRGKCLNKQ